MFKSIVNSLLDYSGVSSFIKIKNESFYSSILFGEPSLVIGEYFMNEDIEIKKRELYQVLFRLSSIEKLTFSELFNLLGFKVVFLFYWYFKSFFNKLFWFFSPTESSVQHYELTSEFYSRVLGETMQYSCGFSDSPVESLEVMQKNKIKRIISKLKIENEQKVLDIGSGYGVLAKSIAESNDSIRVTGINICNEHLNYSIKNTQGMNNILFLHLDYLKLNDFGMKFDRIVSVGMFEHVGKKNYKNFFETINTILNDDGIFLLHTIVSRDTSVDSSDPFLNKYIFPGGILPSVLDIVQSLEGTQLKLQHIEDFGFNYSTTLSHWFNNLNDNCSSDYSDKLIRMYQYYFTICRIGFDTERITLKQFVLTKNYHDVYSFDSKILS
jgi:cyclopropane-fatty-acyl-phospholipid synthase